MKVFSAVMGLKKSKAKYNFINVSTGVQKNIMNWELDERHPTCSFWEIPVRKKHFQNFFGHISTLKSSMHRKINHFFPTNPAEARRFGMINWLEKSTYYLWRKTGSIPSRIKLITFTWALSGCQKFSLNNWVEDFSIRKSSKSKKPLIEIFTEDLWLVCLERGVWKMRLLENRKHNEGLRSNRTPAQILE